MDKIPFDAQLVLEPEAQRDVPFARHIPHEPAGHVEDRTDVRLHMVMCAVAAHIGQITGPFTALGDPFQVKPHLVLLARCAQERISPAHHFFDAVAGRDLKCGIDERQPKIGAGNEEDFGRRIDGGDQAPDVGFKPKPAAGILESHERVAGSQRDDLQVHIA